MVTELDTDTLNVSTTGAVPINTNGCITRSNSTPSLTNGNVDKKVQNGAPPLISRQDLILVPDPDQNYNGNNNVKIDGVSLFRYWVKLSFNKYNGFIKNCILFSGRFYKWMKLLNCFMFHFLFFWTNLDYL